MDDVKRKLALIDRQLAGPADTYKRSISTCPLAFPAAGLIIGILIQSAYGLSLAPWLVLLTPCAVLAIVLFAIQRKNVGEYATYVLALLSCSVLICFVCLGAVRLIHFNEPRPDDIRNSVANEQTLATIRGLIITEPYINRNQNWQFVKFTHSDPTSSFYLKLKQVKTVEGWSKASGILRVQVDEPVLDLKAGDYVQAYCWLDRFKEATNPGQFDIATYLRRKNIFVAASVKSRDGITLLDDGQKGLLATVRERLSQTARQALLGGLPPEDPNQGLLQALLLGYRRNINSKTYEAFRKTGLLHFISLSGLHLGILIGTIWWLCKTAGLMKRARAIVCIIVIAIFLLVVPPRPPTVRAAIIGWVFCASFLFRRDFNSLNTLSLAAIILLLIRPTQLFEPGWQLSFASVLGLVLFCRRIDLFLYEKLTGVAWIKKPPITRPFYRIVSRPGPYLLRLFSTGLTAWMSGAGILLYHFYTINPLTCIWTVIVLPVVALILTIGYLKIILAFVLPTLASALGVLVNWSAVVMIWLVEWIASLGISQILVGHVPLTPIVLYYCSILLAGLVYLRRPLLKRAMCTAMVLLTIFSTVAAKWRGMGRANLVLTCLDVGHGQAILAQLPGKVNILFDAGSLYTSDIGRRIVTPFLDCCGISKIDAIVISHNDIDHFNGMVEIAEHNKVNNVYANSAFLMDMKTEPYGPAAYLKGQLHQENLKIHLLPKDLSSGGGATIKILWPSEQICRDPTLSDNNKSVVSLIEFAGKRILLCSDIEQFAQQQLLRQNPNLKADIVVVPHHGLAKTLDPGFLKQLDAKILMCSCGSSDYRNNRIIKPESKAKWLCTAENGAAIVCIDKHGMIK